MYTTIQNPQEIRDNVALLKRMMGETTRINIIPEQSMTPKQLEECTANATAFDHYLRSKHMTPNGADYSIQNLKTAYVFYLTIEGVWNINVGSNAGSGRRGAHQ